MYSARKIPVIPVMSPYSQNPVSSIDRIAVLALVPCTSIALEIFLGN
nr:MAG TPA: hypothetical protein [Caudoviricetes sp.]